MNLLTVKQVAAKLNVATSYVWRLAEKDPLFPKPIRLGNPDGPRRSRVTRWAEDQINSWIKTKQGELNENGSTNRVIHQDPPEAGAA